MSSVHGPMTPIRKARIWELWRQGYPMSFIADDIAKPPATVYSYLLYHGGHRIDLWLCNMLPQECSKRSP
jgi:hypothetical protein